MVSVLLSSRLHLCVVVQYLESYEVEYCTGTPEGEKAAWHVSPGKEGRLIPC